MAALLEKRVGGNVVIFSAVLRLEGESSTSS